jgi:hypothetical protein
MPQGAALTTQSNIFAASQTIHGSLILTGTGNGITFPDGTMQASAASGSGGGLPTGSLLSTTSPIAPAGYSLLYTSAGGNQWAEVAPMPTGRYGLATVTLNGKIFAIGGSAIGGIRNTVEVYDPSTNSWSGAPNILTPRFWLAATDANGLVYAIGGSSIFGPLLTNEQYSPPVTVYTFIKN